MPHLKDNPAIITGSSTGIDRGLALLFAKLGIHLSHHIDPRHGQETWLCTAK